MATSATTSMMAEATPGVASSKISADRMMMPIGEQRVYKYIYSGSGVTLESEMAVYLKNKSPMTAAEAQGFLGNFKISSIDLKQFTSLTLNSLALSEDRTNGLSLNIDFNEGNLSISKNWNKWAQNNCQTDVCFQQNQMKVGEVLPNEKSLAIAAAFIADHKISTSSYGKPFVKNEWKVAYDLVSDKSQAYIPDTEYVIYPLVIDGKTIYEEYGQAKGITVGIDSKTGLVSEVNGIEKLDFLDSNYPVETDFAKIRALAEKGGRTGYAYPMMGLPQDVKTVTVEVKLGEPTMSYVHLYEYKEGQSSEYFVPALIFPVMQKPGEGEYFQDQIIVPIIKDFAVNNNRPIMYKGGIAE